ncbi:MAG: TPM domain-containing protein [Methylotenera sp.]
MKNKNPIIRFFKHMFSGAWQVHEHFSEAALNNIEQAIKASEATHDSEIRFVVEAGLHPYEILFKKTPRKRAIELFGRLNIWDTEHNNGVLIYLLLADRDVEIVADRGIHQHVGNAEWERICHGMELKFRHGEFESGVLQGIAEIGAHLHAHFPDGSAVTKAPSKKPVQRKKKNEISNKPLIL